MSARYTAAMIFPSIVLPKVARRVRVLAGLGACALALMMTACSDGNRVTELETQISELKEATQKKADETSLAVESLESQRDQLMLRLEQAETQGRTALEQSGNTIAEQDLRFERVERAMAALARRRERFESLAYLPIGYTNHVTLGTAHGTFLVRLDGVLPATGGNTGYVATLNVGNPMGLTVTEFSLRGHFGEEHPTPNPNESDEDFILREEAWEKTLVPFQHLFVTPLEPGQWTQIELPLEAERLSDIKMLRFIMGIDRAYLENQSGIGEIAVLSALSEGTAFAKTPYGMFLLTASGTTPEGSQLRLRISIGNPLLLVIKKVKLTGEYGPTPPKRQVGEDLPTFALRLDDWQKQLKPFEAEINTPILPGRWNDTSILMPTTIVNELGYIRFTFSPEAASFPVIERPGSQR